MVAAPLVGGVRTETGIALSVDTDYYELSTADERGNDLSRPHVASADVDMVLYAEEPVVTMRVVPVEAVTARVHTVEITDEVVQT